ncbi:MAG: C39 family peptidase [Chloroflexi bacterium]|nr:C39 family peptidase [Chloroflexota bacterium]
MLKQRLLILLLIIGAAGSGALAQTNEGRGGLPEIYRMQNLGREYQGWNNCGPATLTNALVHFGYTDDQYRAANWLKPNYEDKNVSAWQMAAFVNTQIPELPVYALVRDGGTLELLQTLMVNGFPVVIEKGYEPPDYTWMGHYLLLAGYDEALSEFDTMDSFKGPNTRYSYEEIKEYWQHFNYKYIVLYTVNRESELMALLGDDADEWQNQINALELARAEAIADQEDAHAWFNMGSSFVELGMYEAAAQAYDKAISLGLPWRMFWYQFGTWEAYYHTERYDDMIRIARQNQNDGGGQYVEETYYYLGMAREGRGEVSKALQNYDIALTFNPNFSPAREAKERLLTESS